MNTQAPVIGLYSGSAQAARRSVAAIAALLAAGMALALLFQPAGGSIPGYLPLHMLFEVFAVIVAMLVFSAGWHAYVRNLPGNIVLLGVAFLGVGLLDFAHVLSYAGMPDFVTPSSPEKGLAFWLTARFLAAAAMLAAVLISPHPFSSSRTRYQFLAAVITFTLLAYWLFLFHLDVMPRTFIPGEGLTGFKIAAEYVLIALYLATGFALWRRMDAQEPFHTPALACAAITMAMSEFFFTRYATMADTYNLLGHVYKVVAYLFLYRAVFLVAVENPYRQLQISKAKLGGTLNAIPDLVWLKDVNGVYLECNPAFERLFGAKRENIIGKSDYDFVDSKLADFFREHDRKAIAANKPSINEEWLTFADGGYRGLFETIKSPMHDETGSLIGVLGIARDISARKKAEDALKESEEKFRRLFQDVADPILLLKEGRFIDCNAAALKLLGYGSREEFINSSPSDISPPCQPDGRSSAEKSAEMDAIALREGFNRFEWVHRRRDGADIPIEVTLTSIYVEGERILHVHWRDITQRKLNEEQLRKLSRAVEQSPVSIVITALDASIEYVNEAFVRETGYTRMEAAGKNLCMLNSDKNPEEACQAMYSSLVNGHAWKGELINRRKDGSEYAELTVISPIFDSRGKVTHCLAIKENITERKNNEAKIERLSRTYRLLSKVNEAIVLSPGKNDLFENICSSAMESGLFQLAWISLVGNARLEPAACSGASCSFLSRLDIRLDDDRCRNWPIVKAIRDDTFIIKQDMDELPHVIPWRGKAAELGLQSVGIFPFHEAGAVAGSINVYAADKQFFTPDIIQLMQELVADVSFALDVFAERERREEAEESTRRANAELEYRVQERTRELQAVNRELEAFCYSVSHDLRAPLRSIDGFSQILLKKIHAQLDGTGKDYLERVSRASQRMGQLIDDLLKLSKVTRGALQRKPVDLSALAEEAADELRKAHPEREVRFLLQPGLAAYADQGLLRIALDNLLGNAFKYTSRKEVAEIEFGVRDGDDEKVFFVRDNGAGFNMDYAHKLFNPFQRLHAVSEFEGTGIGLATVQRIVHRHYGKVWAEAQEGKGATFYFTLPQREEERQGKME